MKKLTIVIAALLLGSMAVKAQNFQIFYDFGSDRKQVTTTAEIFKADKWGNTFSFIDLDYTNMQWNADQTVTKNAGIGGAYFEIARCLNFWQESALKGLSVQLEYNGGLGTTKGAHLTTDGQFSINHAFMVGLDYFFHSKNYDNTLNLKVLYKKYVNEDQQAPLQFTAVWGLKNLFGAKGLTFSGFADFWWEDHSVYPWLNDEESGYRDWSAGETAHCVFLSEPQLWYSVGQHFGCPNLNIGGEVELSVNFGTLKGFRCRPCLGIKWDF